ncbi:MAG: hypothetical protein KGO53_11230 [Alphaproteobacteria bacterium]|nr:hypothetical protein [Alphaproteobacteria bacterium]
MKALSVLLAMTMATPALAAEKLLPFNDANTYFPAAKDKQVDLVFSDALKAKYGLAVDYPGMVVAELKPDAVCFAPSEQGPELKDGKLKPLLNKTHEEWCAPRSEVSAKYDPQEIAGAAPQPFFLTDAKHCKSVWVKGEGIGVWWEDCTYDAPPAPLQYDAKLSGFVLRPPGESENTLVLQFRKKAEEPPDAILPELKARGLIPNDDECKFAASKEAAAPHFKIYDIMPLGKRLAEYKKQQKTGDIPDEPCGSVGLATDYVGYWLIDDRHPDRVVHVDLGQDTSALDPFSISFF